MDYNRQISDLQGIAAIKGYEVVDVITEKISGVKAKREGIERLLNLTESGLVKKVMVTEISRLGRSTLQVLQILDLLESRGVSVYIHNFGIETLQENGRKNPMVSMMLTILAEFASMERTNLIERTRSGLEQARKTGSQLGRPVGSKKTLQQLKDQYRPVIKLLNQGLSIRKVAKLTDTSVNTVLKVKQNSEATTYQTTTVH